MLGFVCMTVGAYILWENGGDGPVKRQVLGEHALVTYVTRKAPLDRLPLVYPILLTLEGALMCTLAILGHQAPFLLFYVSSILDSVTPKLFTFT